MTSKQCFKYNHPIKAIRLVCMDGLTCTTFPGHAVTRAVNQYKSDGKSVA